MTSLAVIQPSFLPWRGYFDIIHKVDLFVFYDDAQYSRGSWRNRNRIKTPQGARWITVPVIGDFPAPINCVKIDNRQNWQHKHLEMIRQSYAKAPYLETYYPLLVDAYSQGSELISDFDIQLTKLLAQWLGISSRWIMSSELGLSSTRTARLIDMCQLLGADHYLSGPTAHSYIEPEMFEAAGITLEYQRYDYPAYPQLHGEFDPFVSVIDLLFSCGPEALAYIWGST